MSNTATAEATTSAPNVVIFDTPKWYMSTPQHGPNAEGNCEVMWDHDLMWGVLVTPEGIMPLDESLKPCDDFGWLVEGCPDVMSGEAPTCWHHERACTISSHKVEVAD